MEIMKRFEISQRTGFDISASIVEIEDEYSTTQCFLLEVIDNRDDVPCRYYNRFNSEWCPPDKEEWLVVILIEHMVETIIDAGYAERVKIKRAYNNFNDMLKL